MKIHFGYRDGSGEYFITVDAARCDGCGACVDACPKGALEKTVVFVGLEDKTVAGVKEECRRRLRETCSDCERGRAAGATARECGRAPGATAHGRGRALCAAACERGFLNVVWSEGASPSGDA